MAGKGSRSIKNLKLWCLGALIFWLLLQVASSVFFQHSGWSIVDILGREIGRSVLHKDVTYRAWNANVGGIYVPVSEKIKPNPYLKVDSLRDLFTSTGEKLTLINPAYMTRLVHDLGWEMYGTKGHITSLRTISPENTPDSWEVEALKQFENGVAEVSEIVNMDDQQIMRIMIPLITEVSCLKCHAAQGYREGDIRGGLSTAISLGQVSANVEKDILLGHLFHFFAFALGAVGLILYYVHCNRLFNQRMVAENRVQEQNLLLENVFNAISSGIAVHEPVSGGEDFRLQRINQAGAMAMNSSSSQLEGQLISEAFPNANKSGFLALLEKVYRTGKSDILRVKRLKGAEVAFWVEYRLSKLKTGEVVAVIEDLTQQKRAEKTEIERRRLYEFLFEDNISSMLLIDPCKAMIVGANSAACSFYGYTKEQFSLKSVYDLNVSSGQEVRQEMQNVARLDRGHFVFKHRLADGSVKDVELFSGPIWYHGKKLLCSIVHDISQRRKYEKEREHLILDLQKAIAEVKTLRGVVPICSHCKKIRNDKGSWDQLEAYIRKHSEAEFSHGICPDCLETHYPELAGEIAGKIR